MKFIFLALQLRCTVQRHLFPLRPLFAMTIHKLQGETYEFVDVVLSTVVFNDGTLYVSFSRVDRQCSLKVLLSPEINKEHITKCERKP